VLLWNERSLTDLRAGIKHIRVGYHLASIIEMGQSPPDQFIDAKLFRPSNFDGAIDRLSDSHPAYSTRDIIGGHGLKHCIRQTHLLAVKRNVRKLFEKFEELGRAHDRIWNR